MDMKRLMQQAQAMQRKIGKIEQELNETEYEGSNNGVTVKVNGAMEVVGISIDEELLEKDNKEMLEDVLMLAFNSASEKASADRDEKLGAVTQGVRFPGM